MRNYLSFVPADQHSHIIVVTINDNRIGEMYQESDGYYVFEPIPRPGYWSAWIMREIADHLDFLNEAWDSQIKEYFDRQEALGIEFDKILHANIWDLFER